jgi:predicted ester cyclase
MAEIINLEANKALVRRFFQDFDSVGLQQALDNNAGTDVIVHNPALSREPLSGAAWAAAVSQILPAFPDLRHMIADVLAEGYTVCVRGTDRYTHRGEFQGILPTGREITISFMAMFRIQNRRIAEIWVEADIVGLLGQLGVQVWPAGRAVS